MIILPILFEMLGERTFLIRAWKGRAPQSLLGVGWGAASCFRLSKEMDGSCEF